MKPVVGWADGADCRVGRFGYVDGAVSIFEMIDRILLNVSMVGKSDPECMSTRYNCSCAIRVNGAVVCTLSPFPY